MRSRRTAGGFLAAMVLAIWGATPSRAAEPSEPLGAMLDDYATIHDALAGDRIEGVAAAAAKIAERAESAAAGAASEDSLLKLAAAARAMTGSDLGALRGQLDDLSKAMAAMVDTSSAAGADLYYCPMVDGYWLQKKGDGKRNPYYGKTMLGCGQKVDRVED